MTKEDIFKRLSIFFKNSTIEIYDNTGDLNHFSILIISDMFNKLSLINRHKIIYNLFKDELTREIHALQIKAFTPQEWNQKNI